MGNELEVDPGDLRGAAANSEAVAGTLPGAALGGSTGSQPSAAGVAALDSAVSAVRIRQSARVSGHTRDLSVASVRYDDTDGDSAEDVSATV